MRRFHTILALVTLGFVMAGCSDEIPVNTNVNTYTGVNGFVVNGGQYANVAVDCPIGSMEFTDALGKQRAIRLSGSKINLRDVEVMLVLPATATSAGEYKWVDGSSGALSDAYMIFDRDGLTFNSITGKTVITSFGGVGGTVTGSFNGAVLDPGTGEKIYFDGKFSVSRLN